MSGFVGDELNVCCFCPFFFEKKNCRFEFYGCIGVFCEDTEICVRYCFRGDVSTRMFLSRSNALYLNTDDPSFIFFH